MAVAGLRCSLHQRKVELSLYMRVKHQSAVMEVGLVKNTFGGSQASRIEIQTFLFIILIAIFSRPLGAVLDAIKFHQLLTGILQTLQFGPRCPLGVQSQWRWAILTAAALLCPNPSSSACSGVPVRIFVELHHARWSSWSGWNMLSSERLGLEKLVCTGGVLEDFASSCPFPFQAEYPRQLASTAGRTQLL